MGPICGNDLNGRGCWCRDIEIVRFFDNIDDVRDGLSHTAYAQKRVDEEIKIYAEKLEKARKKKEKLLAKKEYEMKKQLEESLTTIGSLEL